MLKASMKNVVPQIYSRKSRTINNFIYLFFQKSHFTSRITSYRSPAAAQTQFRTSNGKPWRKRRLRTAGSVEPAVVDWDQHRLNQSRPPDEASGAVHG